MIRGSVLERIADAACPRREKLIVEIGPGRGALTAKLLQRAERVIAVEVDAYLVEHLRARFAAEPLAAEPRLEVLQGDVLQTDLAQWGHVPIAGNLPYYIASAIIERVAKLQPPKAVFLIQNEVAERLVAQPGSRDYGFLTVQVAARMEARLLFRVKPTAFYPPPKIDSAVVLLEPWREPLDVLDIDAFLRFVSQCFRHKRKTLRNNLSQSYPKQVIDSWPEASQRAEQLSIDQFVAMYRRVTAV